MFYDAYEPLDLNNESRPPHLSQRIGGMYDIQNIVGAGRTARVYCAKVYPSNDFVAIKILRESASAAVEQQRLSQEGEALAMLQSQYFPSFIDAGVSEKGEPYMVSSLINGVTLQKILEDYRSLETDKALDIAIQICRALAELHRLGIVHASFKPSDVMLIDQGERHYDVQLVDLDSVILPHGPDLHSDALLGEGATFHYMSPEQALGKPMDARTDVYNCALILYEMVTGRHPYDGSTMADLLTARVNSDIVPIAVAKPELSLPEHLPETIFRCLKANNADRLQTIDELEHKLVAIRKVTPDTKIHAIDQNEWSKKHNANDATEPTDGWLAKLKKMVGLK